MGRGAPGRLPPGGRSRSGAPGTPRLHPHREDARVVGESFLAQHVEPHAVVRSRLNVGAPEADDGIRAERGSRTAWRNALSSPRKLSRSRRHSEVCESPWLANSWPSSTMRRMRSGWRRATSPRTKNVECTPRRRSMSRMFPVPSRTTLRRSSFATCARTSSGWNQSSMSNVSEKARGPVARAAVVRAAVARGRSLRDFPPGLSAAPPRYSSRLLDRHAQDLPPQQHHEDREHHLRDVVERLEVRVHRRAGRPGLHDDGHFGRTRNPASTSRMIVSASGKSPRVVVTGEEAQHATVHRLEPGCRVGAVLPRDEPDVAPRLPCRCGVAAESGSSPCR